MHRRTWPSVGVRYACVRRCILLSIELAVGFMLAALVIVGEEIVTHPARADSSSSAARAATQAAPDATVQEMVDAVSTARLIHHLCKLQDADSLNEYCNAQGGRNTTYVSEITEARNYLSSYFDGLELDWHYHNFTMGSGTYQNVVAELPGVDPTSTEVYIVSAHYDSTSSGSYAPGANDDGSGTASVLEIAEVLKSYQFRHTIRFVLFAGEENGMIGSDAYASYISSQGTDLRGLIQLDMVAYDSDANPVVELHTYDADDVALAGGFSSTVTDYGLILNPALINDGTWGSDHSSFWTSYPAMLVIIDSSRGTTYDWDPDYHTVNDDLCVTPNPGNVSNPCLTYRLNLTYHRKVTQAALATLATLAELAEPAGPPDLAITKSGLPLGRPGGVLTYTVTYTNTGPSTATGVRITDTLPAELSYHSDNSGLPTLLLDDGARWDAGNLAPAAGRTFVVTATVSAEIGQQGPVTNTISIAGTNGDADASPPVARAGTWLCRPPPGDATGDGTITAPDLAQGAAAWRGEPADLTFDVDGDGDVDVSDLQRVTSAWGTSCGD